MNPYSKPTSPSSPSTNIPARFISSTAKRPLAESGYYRSASKDHVSGPSEFTAKEDLEYLKSGYDSARPYLGSSVGSQSGPVTSTHAKLSTSDLAQNYTTNHTNNYDYMSKSIGYSPLNGSAAKTFLSPQRFVIPPKVDYGQNNNNAQNYYSADANLEQTSKQATHDNFNIYSKQNDDKQQQQRKYSEERLQAILENVRNRKFEDKPRYGNPYSDPKISTPEMSNYTKEHRDSFRSEDRPLQLRSSNVSGIQVSSNQTTDRGNKEILSYLTNTNTVPVKPGPYIDMNLLHGGSAYSNNPASGIASYSPLSYTPVNAFSGVNITEPTQKPLVTQASYSSLYDALKKNPIPIENQDTLKVSKEDEKGFSFRDNKEKEISFQKDSGLLGSSLLQSNYSLKQETPLEYSNHKKEYESITQSQAQPLPEIKPRTSEQAQPLPHQPKPFDHLKTTAVQTTLSDSMRLKEQTSPSPYEISNLTSPPVRRHHHLDTASFESNLPLSSADSSMSKKTFYTIEHNNPLAIRAFKDTVAGLAVSSTPEKHTNSHFESPSLFEDLQRALSKQNVQINRIIIETVENYPSRESPNIYRHQPEEYSRPDTTVQPSKAFEPPKNMNKLVFQEVRKEQTGLRDSTPELIPQKLDYSNPASSINIVQQSEGGLISNEPSVRGEIEPKEVEKKAHESNVSSFAQPKSISSPAPVFNEEKVVKNQIPEIQKSETERKNSSSQYTQEQKPSIKDVDFRNEAESQKSAILIEEPLNINYSAQPSERNNEDLVIQKSEESEKKVDESQQSVKQPASEIAIKSPEFSAQKDLSEHAQEIQPPLSINEVVQPELWPGQEVNKPEPEEKQQQEVEELDNNKFEDANDSQEEQEIKRQEESEKSDKIEEPENIQPQEKPETDVIRHRVIEEPKEEIKPEVPEKPKKTAALPKDAEPKSSNIAVKVVIGLLVVMLLAILGSELMPSNEDQQ